MFGQLALIEPAKLVPALKEHTRSPAAFTRSTVIIAVKYSIVEHPGKIDDIIYPEISSFLMLIKDSDWIIANFNKYSIIFLCPDIYDALVDAC